MVAKYKYMMQIYIMQNKKLDSLAANSVHSCNHPPKTILQLGPLDNIANAFLKIKKCPYKFGQTTEGQHEQTSSLYLTSGSSNLVLCHYCRHFS